MRADKSVVRALALTAATLHVVLCAVAGFMLVFFATFPFENQSPEQTAADDWLIGAGLGVVILALVIGGAVIARRTGAAAVALTAQLALGSVVAAYAVRESDHSDGRLLLFVLAFAGTAVGAALASRADRRISSG